MDAWLKVGESEQALKKELAQHTADIKKIHATIELVPVLVQLNLLHFMDGEELIGNLFNNILAADPTGFTENNNDD